MLEWQSQKRGAEVAHKDLRDFVQKLEKHDELKRIQLEVDPILEITEISDRAVKSKGPALLFEHPKNSKIPVLTNLVGTERRMCLALEVNDLQEVASRNPSAADPARK
jgi:4-hydroxy-3-polyprenylbenzoate decarboxylase